MIDSGHTQSLTRCLATACCFAVQLEESERAASKQAKLCTARLSYLKQVDQLALQNKDGQADFEVLEEEEQGGQAADSDEPQRQSRPPPPRKAARAGRNVHEEMEVDGPHPFSLSLSAASPATPAAKPAEDDVADNFSVTPRMRLDRIFADHLLRTSQSQRDLSRLSAWCNGHAI